jgi:hypothetical protein
LWEVMHPHAHVHIHIHIHIHIHEHIHMHIHARIHVHMHVHVHIHVHMHVHIHIHIHIHIYALTFALTLDVYRPRAEAGMKAWRGDLGKAVDRNDAKKRKPGRGDTRNGAKPKAQGGRGTASFFLGEQRGGAPAAAAVRTRVAARALAEGGGNCAPVCPGWDQERRAVAV